MNTASDSAPVMSLNFDATIGARECFQSSPAADSYPGLFWSKNGFVPSDEDALDRVDTHNTTASSTLVWAA